MAKVTLPAGTFFLSTPTDHSSSVPVTMLAAVAADAEDPVAVGSGRLLLALSVLLAAPELPQPAAKRAAAATAASETMRIRVMGSTIARFPENSAKERQNDVAPLRLPSGRDDVARIGPLVRRRLAVVAVEGVAAADRRADAVV